jgi:hypothetical protein
VRAEARDRIAGEANPGAGPGKRWQDLRMVNDPESEIPVSMQRYPAADITPSEYEEFVFSLFGGLEPLLDNLKVQLLERIAGMDGSYTFDVTVRYSFAGLVLAATFFDHRAAGFCGDPSARFDGYEGQRAIPPEGNEKRPWLRPEPLCGAERAFRGAVETSGPGGVAPGSAA